MALKVPLMPTRQIPIPKDDGPWADRWTAPPFVWESDPDAIVVYRFLLLSIVIRTIRDARLDGKSTEAQQSRAEAQAWLAGTLPMYQRDRRELCGMLATVTPHPAEHWERALTRYADPTVPLPEWLLSLPGLMLGSEPGRSASGRPPLARHCRVCLKSLRLRHSDRRYNRALQGHPVYCSRLCSGKQNSKQRTTKVPSIQEHLKKQWRKEN